jgi:K(+)-stimulated pyrophosphate-energized sodium pump
VKLIVWIFAMRFLMDFMSGASYFINQRISITKYKGLKEFDFEAPLTRLIWIASILCITTSYGMSWLLIGDLSTWWTEFRMPQLWWQLASIISCGTLAAVLIPEFTKVFTSSHSKHVNEIVTASREGGASLTILSGIVAGNFSAFWKGMLIAGPDGNRVLHQRHGDWKSTHRDRMPRSSPSAWWRSGSCAWARSISRSTATAR